MKKILLTLAVIAALFLSLASNATLERQRTINHILTAQKNVTLAEMSWRTWWDGLKWFFGGRNGTVLPDDSPAHGICGDLNG